MPERGQVLVLTGGRPAERWRWYTALYPYLASVLSGCSRQARYAPGAEPRVLRSEVLNDGHYRPTTA